jgi:alpha-mannosidase
MRLTLLRGTTIPDPMADYGEHRFTYSLLPHEGSWGIETVREAYALNDPLIVYQTEDRRPKTEEPVPNPRSPVDSQPFVSVNTPNIVIETIKRAEDGDGIIVRMYECQRQRGPFILTATFPLAAAWRANILEENRESIPVEGNRLNYAIKPYQILTLRLQFQNG